MAGSQLPHQLLIFGNHILQQLLLSQKPRARPIPPGERVFGPVFQHPRSSLDLLETQAIEERHFILSIAHFPETPSSTDTARREGLRSGLSTPALVAGSP